MNNLDGMQEAAPAEGRGEDEELLAAVGQQDAELAVKLSGALRRLRELEAAVADDEQYSLGWVDAAAAVGARWSAVQTLADTTDVPAQRGYLAGYARGYVDCAEASPKYRTGSDQERDGTRLEFGRAYVAGIRALVTVVGRAGDDGPLGGNELVRRVPWLFDALLSGAPDPPVGLAEDGRS